VYVGCRFVLSEHFLADQFLVRKKLHMRGENEVLASKSGEARLDHYVLNIVPLNEFDTLAQRAGWSDELQWSCPEALDILFTHHDPTVV
jgi:hypothetical protein